MVTVWCPGPKVFLCVGMGASGCQVLGARVGGQAKPALARRAGLVLHRETHVSYLEENS